MKTKYLPILLGLSVIFLGLAFYFSKVSSFFLSTGEIATLSEAHGKVELATQGSNKKKSILKNEKVRVRSLDVISTSSESDTLISFDNKFQVRLFEDSEVLVDQVLADREENKIVLLIRKGDVQIENFGESDKLVVSKDGKRMSAKDYEFQFKRTAVNQLKINSNNVEADESLSSEQIERTLKAQQNEFYRCYLKVLQKMPGVTGSASLTFQIESSGKVTQPQVSAININDVDFKACLLEILKRTQFKNFNGPSISTVFPLRFE